MTRTEVDEAHVVLVDDEGGAIGTAPKLSVHHAETPFHLAFSCYIFDTDGRVLVTRRALGKKAWPGVWTNSCCGHPEPGEPMASAVQRRVGEELGVAIDEPTCVLPRFRYRAVAPDGIVENEFCPVFTAVTRDDLRPDPDEVMQWQWVPWPQLVALADIDWAVSPWAAQQIPLLVSAGIGSDRESA